MKIVGIYDYLHRHLLLWVSSLCLLTALLIYSFSQQTYKEDVSDFLPLNTKYRNAMDVFQHVSDADKVAAVFSFTGQSEPDSLVICIDDFCQTLEQCDTMGLTSGMVYRLEMEDMVDVADFVYANIPYFLTSEDYARFDSLLSDTGYVRRCLASDKEKLMLPGSGTLATNVGKDPLDLFGGVLSELGSTRPSAQFDTYDGYVFSEDMNKAVVLLTSPYGGSETGRNAKMMEHLRNVAHQVQTRHTGLDVNFVGGPVIAVGNSSQIKTDSILAILIAVFLIVALMFFVFRRVLDILLIVVSIAWGWLFAIGCLSLVHDRISIIVVGISSVIIGIAVNYPLHLIAHRHHTPDIRSALKEIVKPLLIGNVTTVGAFMALVPLKSAALRDLGLFSAFLLIGTIVFVLIFLPHLLKAKGKQIEHRWLDRIGGFTFENKRWFVVGVVVLTVVLFVFSFQTSFDPNLRNINYMDEQDKTEMAYFQQMMGNDAFLRPIYVVSSDTSIDKALDQNRDATLQLYRLQKKGVLGQIQGVERFLCSRQEQSARLHRWNDFKQLHGEILAGEIRESASAEGFSPDAFEDFFRLLETSYSVQSFDYFSILTTTAFSSNISRGSDGTCNVITKVLCTPSSIAASTRRIEDVCKSQLVFDVDGMNASVANNLSNDFNYIGWACGLIVFLFLWLSMGHFELAGLSFLPMALSWVWILGIMGVFGIDFNVVNVILATFIFGQGDDYTIFMTEGCQYEYAYHRKMLSSYKGSIIISALVMFIGIGSLIVAKHPALHSLAEVTIVGMFSVVLMAYLFPPLLFNWLVKKRNAYRMRPISLPTLLRGLWCAVMLFFQWVTSSVYRLLLTMAGCAKERRTRRVSAFVVRCLSFYVRHLPSVDVKRCGMAKTAMKNAVVRLESVNSLFDVLLVVAMGPRCVVVSSKMMPTCWLIRKCIALSGVEVVGGDNHVDDSNSVKIDVSGTMLVFPEWSWAIHPGTVVLSDSDAVSSRLCEGQGFNSLKRFVLDRYRYKGIQIYRQVKQMLSVDEADCQLSSMVSNGVLFFSDGGWGALPLLMALLHPECQVEAKMSDADHLLVARGSAGELAPNLTFSL